MIMDSGCKLFSFWLTAALLFSCTQTPEKGAYPSFEGEWPCFNGCSIVLSGEKYGLVQDSGEMILPPIYEAIEFLDNDVALLKSREQYFLCDRNGRILGEGDELHLRQEWQEITAECLEKDRRSWEKVLERYELLLRQCKASRGKRLFRNDFSPLQALKDSVLVSLKSVTGSPTPSQKARLEALSGDYRRAFQ